MEIVGIYKLIKKTNSEKKTIKINLKHFGYFDIKYTCRGRGAYELFSHRR